MSWSYGAKEEREREFMKQNERQPNEKTRLNSPPSTILTLIQKYEAKQQQEKFENKNDGENREQERRSRTRERIESY